MAPPCQNDVIINTKNDENCWNWSK